MKYISFIVFLLSLNLFGQQDARDSLRQKDKDLKVGLVLSGGGAKGLAHIGALKVIEKSGVRVDYIGGTSMGAIVGSLYAAGYSAHQIDSIFRKTNFSTLIQDDLPRRVKTYYQRKDSKRYVLSLPFDDFKLSIPSGLSKGQNFYNLLSQLLSPVDQIDDFSQLSIPFFCIGTDIETGKRLVLDHGSLPQAVSASSAIPSLFKPVLIDDKLVSDGGITDNYPVEELRKHDLDYIIGVDVQDSLSNRKQLQSVFDILRQVNNFDRIKAMKEKRKLTDLYIKPDIKDFTVLSFNKEDAIIDSGQGAAEAVKNTLDSIARQQKGRDNRPRGIDMHDTISINEIEIKGDHKFKRNFIRGKLKIPTHSRINYSQLNEGLENLAATGDFNRINYKLVPQEDGSNNLRLILNENPNKTSLKFSLHYDQLYKSAALINFTHKQLFFRNDLISFDFGVGENLRYSFDYFIDKGSYWSIGLHSSLNQFDKSVNFDAFANKLPEGNYNVSKINLDYLDITNQLYVESLFFNLFRLGAGLEHKYTKLKTGTIRDENAADQSPYVVLEQSHLFGPYAYAEYDNYDNTYFPEHGLYFRGDMHSYLFGAGASFNFRRFSTVKGKIGYAFTPLARLSVRAQASTGFQLGHSPMSNLDFFLGGFGNDYVNNIEPFFGYDFLSKIGDSFIKSSLRLDYEIFIKNHILLGYNIANIGDNLYDHGKIFNVPDYSGFSLGYGMETFLGPLEAYYSISPETGKSEWFISLGFWF